MGSSSQRSSERRDALVAALVLLLAATFVVRVSGLPDLGLIELIPVLLAAFALGRRAAEVTAIAGSITLVGANFVDKTIAYGGLGPRVALLLITGVAVGRLIDQRDRQARQIQDLLPLQDALAPAVPPDLPLLEIATRYLPATLGVSGDFYLIAEGHNSATVVVIADVVGKGMEAAKRATFVRATLSASAAYSEDPAHLLRVANAELIRQYGVSTQFITMLCVIVRPDASLAWCSAGHPPPVLLADGSPLGTTPPSYPLGIAPELEDLHVGQGTLPEHGILLYTDGLTDARPPTGTFEPFGHKRIGLFLRDLADPTPEAAVDRLTTAARTFAGGVLPDDLCLVAVRSRFSKPVLQREPPVAEAAVARLQ
jgi:hypothetical protein